MNRKYLKEVHEGIGFGEIRFKKSHIARNLLELNRFGFDVDLLEAESALVDNIQQFPASWVDKLLLVILDIRRGFLSEARDRYDREKLLAPPGRWKRLTRGIRSEIEFEFSFSEGHWEHAIQECETSIDTYQGGGYRWSWARQAD